MARWNARFPDGENGKLKKRRPELQSCCRGGSHYAGDLAVSRVVLGWHGA